MTPASLGLPTKLLRKTLIVGANENRLPVYTLTFAIPTVTPTEQNGDHLDVVSGNSDTTHATTKIQPQSQEQNGHVHATKNNLKAVQHPLLRPPAIHHSLIRLDMGDIVKMVIPNYKPKSYSVSELRSNEFDVTFKVYPNGRASGYLDRLNVGDHIYSFGKHVGRRYNPGMYIGIIVFGVGITEGLPVAKAELEKDNMKKVVLLWANRTFDDTFWHDKIEHLKTKYSDRFEIHHLLSRQQKDGCLHGRIHPELLLKVFQPLSTIPKEQVRFLSVGTKEMMRHADDMISNIGYSIPEHHLLPKIKNNNPEKDKMIKNGEKTTKDKYK